MYFVPTPTPPSVIDECLRALANPSRVVILRSLSQRPMTVTELREELPQFSQATISKHLSVLRMLGLVSFTSQGLHHTYTVARNLLTLCADFIRDIAGGGAA